MARCNSCNQNNVPVLPPVECPNPIKCDEVIDSLCVLYTGEAINLCQTYEVSIDTSDDLTKILQILVDKICALETKKVVKVEINHFNSGEPFPTLVSQVTGGQGPYTYEWRAANNVAIDPAFIDPATVMGGHRVIGSKTNPSINLEAINIMGIQSKFDMDDIKQTYIELIVTDSLGNKGNAYYKYTSSCYETTPVTPLARPAFLGDLLKTTTGYPGAEFKYPALDFCENYDNMTNCDNLKNLYCVPGYEYGADADAEYRSESNDYKRDLNENLLASQAGVPVSQLVDLQPQIDDLKDLCGLLGYRPDDFMTFSHIEGCPECTKEIWNVVIYDGKTLDQIFPTLNSSNCYFYYIPQSDTFPTVGQPGQLFINTNDPGTTYAWYPGPGSSGSWDSNLGYEITTNVLDLDLQNEYRIKLNDFMMSHITFIESNLYVPFHRWKYNTIRYNHCGCSGIINNE